MSDAFGGERPVTFEDVVRYVRDTKPSTITPSEAYDIAEILEYLHDACLQKLNELDERERSYKKRMAHLTKQEAILAARKKALDAALKVQPRPRKRLFFLDRYSGE